MNRDFSTLEAVPAGAAVFIDANIFIYHFLGASRQCEAFLERCAAGDVSAVTGAHVIAEVLHRLMIAEAKAKRAAAESGSSRQEGGMGGGRASDVGASGRAENAAVAGTSVGVAYLEANPDDVRRLTDYHAAGQVIEQIAKTVLPLTMEVVRASQWAGSRDGLLVNDSLTAAMMRAEGIVNLASNDAAFLRTADFALYRPTDV